MAPRAACDTPILAFLVVGPCLPFESSWGATVGGLSSPWDGGGDVLPPLLGDFYSEPIATLFVVVNI
jgi:hypothetical protein